MSKAKLPSDEPNGTNLFDLVEAVADERTFVEFLRALAEDHVQAPDGWESRTIGEMLESATAWSDDAAWRSETDEPNIWKRCAEIIFAGKHYE